MAILSFPAAPLHRLIDHARAAPDHNMGWSDAPAQPALFLVGDDGVYLMSNGIPRDLREDGSSGAFVVHALGLNPNTDPDCWEAKRASFGAEDGAETLCLVEEIDLKLRRGEAFIRLEITPDSIALVVPDISWITPGVLVETPSGLGGVFRAEVIRVSDTYAWVQNAGNAADFDKRDPYTVPLAHLRPQRNGEGA